MIRYNELPHRFLFDQDPGFRGWAREQARIGRLYYSPSRGALQVFMTPRAALAEAQRHGGGWVPVTVGRVSPAQADRAWRGSQA